MKPRLFNAHVAAVALLATALLSIIMGQTNNAPPEVSIIWPRSSTGQPPACQFSDNLFRTGTYIKMKASAGDCDRSIAQVQFFGGTNLLGVVSNAPFSLIWQVIPNESTPWSIKAVAVDAQGARSESAPVAVYWAVGLNSPPVFAITSPARGSVFGSGENFVLSAELLASPLGDTGPVEFFVGTNMVGFVAQTGPFTTSTPPYSLLVTNVPEGEHTLRLKKDGVFAAVPCPPITIRVTKLGMRFPRLTSGSRLEFNVVTSFPTNQHVIEASSNLLNWAPISTNVPFTNTFLFTDPSPAANSPRFYRAVVPSQ